MDPLVLAVIFFALAAALAAADLFVPSGGGLAIASLLAAVSSVYCAFRSSQTAGLVMLVLLLVAIPLFITLAIRIWPYTPIGRRIILKTPSSPEATKTAPNPLLELVGQVGVTQNSLMPCGFVRIDGRNYSAVCDSGVIDAGQNVVVVGLQQRNLLVSVTSQSVSKPAKSPLPEPESPEKSLLDRSAEELGLDSID